MIFFILSIIIFNTVAYIIPKRISKIEIFVVALQALAFGQISDLIFGINFRLYAFFPQGSYLPWLAVQIGLYIPSNIILFNYFPFHKSIKYKIFYVLLCSVFSITYELLSLKAGYFYYTGWKTWYSAAYYILVFSLFVSNLSRIRKWIGVD